MTNQFCENSSDITASDLRGTSNDVNLEVLNLPLKLRNILTKAGILTISDLLSCSNKRLFKIKNIGKKYYKNLQNIKNKYKSGKIYAIEYTDLCVDQGIVDRLNTVYQLYKKLGTLQAVAVEMGITRERVRQLLRKGQEYKLYTYETTTKSNLKNLSQSIEKQRLVQEIGKSINIFKICSSLNITVSEYHKLIRLYQIDTQEYLKDGRKKKYLLRYSKIVESLGHHPSTTEMQDRREWRYTSLAIQRIWGTTDRFRSEFGIERPAYNIHPNTFKAFRKAAQTRKNNKLHKMKLVIDLINNNKIGRSKVISQRLNIPHQTIILYLKQLVDQNKIKKIGNKRSVRYVSF